jgi:hypothetical protein
VRAVIVASALYVLAMVLANASIAYFGPWISPLNSFVLIGFDLAMRDWLHVRISGQAMAVLICFAGLMTWLLNAAPAQIAIASAVSFVLASSADWLTFSALRKHSWLKRANASNVVGGAVDSLIFPTLAFGVLMPHIVALQFVAKVTGGAMWAWVLRK